MEWNPGQSLRNFATSQPPLLMFTVCLMAFGITMVVLAYIVGITEVPNPDVVDWNKFLSKLTELEICIDKKHLKNFSTRKKESNKNVPPPVIDPHFRFNATQNTSIPRYVGHSKSMSAVLSKVVDRVTDDDAEDVPTVNVSVKINLWITAGNEVLSSVPSILKGSVTGKHLGLHGKLSSKLLNITFTFPAMSNITCEIMCHVIKTVCLTVQMSSSLLPHTKSPEKCEKADIPLEEEGAVVEFIEQQEVSSSKVCQNKTHLHLHYVSDSRLTEMLTVSDRSIVNLHLMHTSYFMFVMVMTLLCYVLIKGRSSQPKIMAVEKLPLHPQ